MAEPEFIPLLAKLSTLPELQNCVATMARGGPSKKAWPAEPPHPRARARLGKGRAAEGEEFTRTAGHFFGKVPCGIDGAG